MYMSVRKNCLVEIFRELDLFEKKVLNLVTQHTEDIDDFIEDIKRFRVENAKINNAKNLLKLGIEINIISQATGLSKEKVLELKKEI